jgi:hypothetical protein
MIGQEERSRSTSMPLTAPSLWVEAGRPAHRPTENENRGIRQLSIFAMPPFSYNLFHYTDLGNNAARITVRKKWPRQSRWARITG